MSSEGAGRRPQGIAVTFLIEKNVTIVPQTRGLGPLTRRGAACTGAYWRSHAHTWHVRVRAGATGGADVIKSWPDIYAHNGFQFQNL